MNKTGHLVPRNTVHKPISSSALQAALGKFGSEQQGAPHNRQQDKDLPSQHPAPPYTHKTSGTGLAVASTFSQESR